MEKITFLDTNKPLHRKVWAWMVYYSVEGTLIQELTEAFETPAVAKNKPLGQDFRTVLGWCGVEDLSTAKFWVTIYDKFLSDPEIISIAPEWELHQDFTNPGFPWEFEIGDQKWVEFFADDLAEYYVKHLVNVSGKRTEETTRAYISLNKLLYMVVFRWEISDLDSYFDELTIDIGEDFGQLIDDAVISLPILDVLGTSSIRATDQLEMVNDLISNLAAEGARAVTWRHQTKIFFPEEMPTPGSKKRPHKRA